MLNGIPPQAQPLEGLAEVLGAADFAFANLEIPLTDSRAATRRKTPAELRTRSQFILKAHPDHAPHLADVGIDAVSLANNHAMDYGAGGLEQTRSLLSERGIVHAGAGSDWREATLPAIVERHGVRIALVSYLAFIGAEALRKCTPATDVEPGIAVLSFGGRIGPEQRKILTSIVQRARSEADLVVVALHWGIEKQRVPTSYQVALARAFVDAGADVVWGHHPHVLQGWERQGDGVIFYSLGNLISPMPAVTGLFRLTYRGKELVDVMFIPAQISGGRTRLLEDGSAEREVARMIGLNEQLTRRFSRRSTNGARAPG